MLVDRTCFPALCRLTGVTGGGPPVSWLRQVLHRAGRVNIDVGAQPGRQTARKMVLNY